MKNKSKILIGSAVMLCLILSWCYIVPKSNKVEDLVDMVAGTSSHMINDEFLHNIIEVTFVGEDFPDEEKINQILLLHAGDKVSFKHKDTVLSTSKELHDEVLLSKIEISILEWVNRNTLRFKTDDLVNNSQFITEIKHVRDGWIIVDLWDI